MRYEQLHAFKNVLKNIRSPSKFGTIEIKKEVCNSLVMVQEFLATSFHFFRLKSIFEKKIQFEGIN